MADTVGCAWAVARFGNAIVVDPAKQTEALLYLSPASLRIDSDTTICLHQLGLRHISQLISIPRTALRRRFGQSIIKRLDQALGKEEEIIQPIIPVEAYQERLPCPEPISQLAGIEIALEHLLQQLCNRLQKEGKGIRNAYFRCYRIDNQVSEIQIATSRSSTNVKHLMHLFQMKVETIEPGLGIELFLMEATKVEDFTPTQSVFWKRNGFE
jgi:protein ImuB